MIITQTPLRISFLGGNTDFKKFYEKHSGCVLSTSIDKYIYCIVKERFDKKIAVSWSKKETVENVNELQHELVREALKLVGIKNSIEINFIGDIPSEGSGLGSSSSVTVGVLNALHHFVGETPTATQLAEEAIKIEIEILKKPIGVQDQYIAAFGGLRFFEFKKRSITTNLVRVSGGIIDDLDSSLMLFYTGKTRKATTILTGVEKRILEKTQSLLQIKKLAQDGKNAIEKGNIDQLGKLMNDNWQIKKSLSSKISTQAIDKMYHLAISAGALGGKITGAGGGGFMLLMVPSKARTSVRRVLSKHLEVPFRLEKDGSKVIFNVRRY